MDGLLWWGIIIWSNSDRSNYFFASVLIITSAGCEVGDYKGKKYEVVTFDDLLEALKYRGQKPKEIKVEKDEVENSYFSVSARQIKVGDEMISVFEFEDAETANSQAETISKDGYTIADTEISWTDEPHFFQKGNIIVGYIGEDEKLLFDLHVILESSITE